MAVGEVAAYPVHVGWHVGEEAKKDGGNEVYAKFGQTACIALQFFARSTESVAKATHVLSFLGVMRDWIDAAHGLGFLRYMTRFESSEYRSALKPGESFWHDLRHIGQNKSDMLLNGLLGCDGLLAFSMIASRAESAVGNTRVMGWAESKGADYVRSGLVTTAFSFDILRSIKPLIEADNWSERGEILVKIAQRLGVIFLIVHAKLGGKDAKGTVTATLLAAKVFDAVFSAAKQHQSYKAQRPLPRGAAADAFLSTQVAVAQPLGNDGRDFLNGAVGDRRPHIHPRIVDGWVPGRLATAMSSVVWLAKVTLGNGVKQRQKLLSVWSNVFKLIELGGAAVPGWTPALHAASSAMSAWKRVSTVFDCRFWSDLGQKDQVNGVSSRRGTLEGIRRYSVEVFGEIAVDAPVRRALAWIAAAGLYCSQFIGNLLELFLGLSYLNIHVPWVGSPFASDGPMAKIGATKVWNTPLMVAGDFGAAGLVANGLLEWKKCFTGCPGDKSCQQQLSYGELRTLGTLTERQLSGLGDIPEGEARTIRESLAGRNYISQYSLGKAVKDKSFERTQAFFMGTTFFAKAVLTAGYPRLYDKKWGKIVLATAGIVNSGVGLIAGIHRSWHQDQGNQSVRYQAYVQPRLAAAAA